jgi:hypothetical protein
MSGTPSSPDSDCATDDCADDNRTVDDPYLLADGRPVIVWKDGHSKGAGASGAAYRLSADPENYDHYYTAHAPGHGIIEERHDVIEEKRWESYNAARLTRDAEIREAVRIYCAGGEDLLDRATARAVLKDIEFHPPLESTWLPDGAIIKAIREGGPVVDAILPDDDEDDDGESRKSNENTDSGWNGDGLEIPF